MVARPGSDATIFIDANIFLNVILGAGKESASCARFLEEADAGAFPSATSVIVLNEVLHRLLIASVVNSHGIGPDSAVHHMKSHPELVRDAGIVWEVMEDIRSIRPMKIYGISPATFERSLAIMQEGGLLGNDALHVACMEEHSIDTIATYDRDFSQVSGIKIRKPADTE
jgi:predicted nucleic acid-binding protein